MKPVLLLVAMLCVSASAYSQDSRPQRELTFERGNEVRGERPGPGSVHAGTDHGGARESGGNQQGPSRVNSSIQAAREEVQRLLALIDDPVNGPLIANNPDLQQAHLKALREAMAYVRMLEDRERSDVVAREAAAREAAARETGSRAQRREGHDHP